MSNPLARPSRSRRWPLFLVLGLVVALAVVWTGFWFYAAAQAKTEIASWRERERQAGRRQDCASLSVGGYPFRIEVRCADGNFELQGTPTLRLDLPSVLAVVQVYDPRLLISEFKGPLNVSQQSGRNEFILDWDVGRASARGRLPSQVERVSLALEALSVRDSGTGNADPTSMGVKLPDRELLIRRSKRYCRSSTQPRKRCTPLPRRRSMRTSPA